MKSAVKENWLAALACAALMAVTLAVFWGARKCQFVDYDDPVYITSNQAVQHGLSGESVRWAFETGAASNWHPLTWISHLTDVQLYGMNPAGHHLTSIVLHAVNGALLFLLLRSMTGAFWPSFVVAALFALHPLRVESVAWVSERKDVLSTFFWMLAAWAYVVYAKKSEVQSSKFKVFYILSLLFFTCGLMSKPMLVTLPFILLLLDYWPLQRWGKGLPEMAVEKIPFLVLAIASSIITFFVQRAGGAVSTLAGVPIGARIGNALVSYIRYLGKLFWPVGLSPLYPHPGYWAWWKIAASVLILAAITAGVVRRRRPQPYLIVGWLWFVIMLAPVIGLLQVGIQSMADRYSYVASVGVLIMLVWSARDCLGSKPWLLGTAAAFAVGACVVLTPRQVTYWRTSETLFSHAVAVTDNNYLAYNNLGYDLSNHGEMERAMGYFQKSLEINSNYDEAHNNLGYALAALGRYKEATNEYIKALSINRNLTQAHNNLGIALGNLGYTDAAITEYQIALEENPNFADAHNNYGIALAMKGKLDDAIAQFNLAIACQENYLSAHSDLGNALAMKGDFEGAIREYEFCLKLDPNDSRVHNNLGNTFAQRNRLDEAIAQYRLALTLQANNPEAHFNLGYCLAKKGQLKDAEEQCVIALQQRPNYPEARQQLDALRKTR